MVLQAEEHGGLESPESDIISDKVEKQENTPDGKSRVMELYNVRRSG